MADFTHLHLHTQYSFLDGAIHIKDLFGRIAEQGMDACAMTDHGNLYGAIDFYQRAQKRGIKPILGCEVNVAANGRADRTTAKSQHLILLATDNGGWKNLMNLVSMGHTEGFYYRPRIDLELLREKHEGLVALSGCMGGGIPRAFIEGDSDAARERALEMKTIFGERFYLELQDHAQPDQRKVNDCLKQLAKDTEIPLVATNNCHYVHAEDAPAHDILQCIKDGKSRNDPQRWRRRTNKLYIRSPDEMIELFSDVPQAIENTQRIRDMCKVELELGKPMLPTFQTPGGVDLETHLRESSRAGLEQRFTEISYAIDRDEYYARLEEELGIIIGMKFPGYFLIVADFINWSKNNGIPVGPGRGSGAGSLVAYALRITDIDPLPYTLLFERFLNPERVSMPDFDVDFCQERRGEVIDYVRGKYGRESVGQIGTFAQMKAKSVIKDVARAMEVEFSKVNAITRLLPDTYKTKKGAVKPITIDKALELDSTLREMAEALKADDRDVIGTARRLEGLYRQAGVHAAGVVIADGALWDTVPVFLGKDKELVAQFSMVDVELAGLVKFDFLGLKTLDVVHGAEIHVNRRIQRELAAKDLKALQYHAHLRKAFVDEADLKSKLAKGEIFCLSTALDKVPQSATGVDVTLRSSLLARNDRKVYQLIGTGQTIGVFQLESVGFQKLLKRLKPDCFEDIVAAVALYRPGPLQTGMVEDFIDCKHGRKQVKYPHPLLEEVLKPTYGGFVYQEQVMKAAQVMANYSLGGADLLRRAMGKKKAEAMAKERVKFVAGCKDKGIDNAKAGEVFDLMETFAGYGFNKSHSAAYALITYQTAYLKAYYPVEFMAALLSTELTSTDNIVKDIADAKSMGIAVLPPTVNESDINFTVNEGRIRFGLGAIKGLGESALQAILQARGEGGSFTSVYDFTERVSLKQINKKALETLVRSGAFDDFDIPRARLLDGLENAIEAAKSTQRDIAAGQDSLFAAAGLAQAVKPREVYDETIVEWPERERLKFEREALGFYVTGHPLERYKSDLSRLTDATIAGLEGVKPNSTVTLGVIIGAIKERPLKDGSGRMAFVNIEDQTGVVEIRIGPREFQQYEMLIKSDEPLLLDAMIWFDRTGDTPTPRVKCRAFRSIAEVRQKGAQRVQLSLGEEMVEAERIERFKAIFKDHPGDCKVGIRVHIADTADVELALPDDMRLAATEAMVDQVEAVFGRGVVRFA